MVFGITLVQYIVVIASSLFAGFIIGASYIWDHVNYETENDEEYHDWNEEEGA